MAGSWGRTQSGNTVGWQFASQLAVATSTQPMQSMAAYWIMPSVEMHSLTLGYTSHAGHEADSPNMHEDVS
eukprot:366182-Chlamydomonas_euryale.AAC.14